MDATDILEFSLNIGIDCVRGYESSGISHTYLAARKENTLILFCNHFAHVTLLFFVLIIIITILAKEEQKYIYIYFSFSKETEIEIQMKG